MNEALTRYQVDGGVATITLHRPEAMNAFNRALRAELLQQMQRAEHDSQVRVIVLAGAGKGFCAGNDLKEHYSPPHAQVEGMILEEYKPLLDAITHSSKPYIGAVQGVAAGIGMSFVLNCDLLLMAEDAYLYAAFAPIGLVPDGGATWHLVHSLGYRNAYQAIVEGRKIPATECLRTGLANQVLPLAGFHDAVSDYAKTLAGRAPLALRHSKRLARNSMRQTLEESIRDEAAAQNITMASRDAQEAVEAFFEKRPAVFEGK